MAKILVKNNLAPAVYEFIIEAPMIAHKCQPGQFVMIRTDENSFLSLRQMLRGNVSL